MERGVAVKHTLYNSMDRSVYSKVKIPLQEPRDEGVIFFLFFFLGGGGYFQETIV